MDDQDLPRRSVPSISTQTSLLFQANSLTHQDSRAHTPCLDRCLDSCRHRSPKAALIRTLNRALPSSLPQGSPAMSPPLSSQTSVPGTPQDSQGQQGQPLTAAQPWLPSPHTDGTATAKDDQLAFGLAVTPGGGRDCRMT